jgi:hypothetical protein
VARAASRVAAAVDGGAPVGGVTWMAARSAPASNGSRSSDEAASEHTERRLVIAGWTALGVGLPLAVAGAAGWRHLEVRTAAPLIGCGAALAVAGTVWAVATPTARRPRARAAAIAGALWIAAAAVAAVVATRQVR